MAVAERVDERVARLRETLEEPLLVTSGNEPSLPDRLRELERGAARRRGTPSPLHRLPLRRGRACARRRRVRPVAALAVEDGRRDDRRARRLRGAGADVSGLAGARRRRGSSSCRATGLVERLRAVKEEHELAAIREAVRITDAVYAAFARGALRRPDRARPRVAHGAALPRARRSRGRVRDHRRLRPDRRAAARPADRSRRRGEHDGRRGRRLRRRRLQLRLDADVRYG